MVAPNFSIKSVWVCPCALYYSLKLLKIKARIKYSWAGSPKAVVVLYCYLALLYNFDFYAFTYQFD